METKKKIVSINWNISGGSIASIMNYIEKYAKKDYEFYYVYQVGEKSHDNFLRVSPWIITKVYYVLARVTGIKYGMGTLSTMNLVRRLKLLHPDIVHIHCPNFYNINLYYLFEKLKEINVPIVVTNHAEFFYTGNCAHAFDCTGYFRGCIGCQRSFDEYHKYLVNRTEFEWKKMKKIFENKNIVLTAVSPWAMERIKKAPITKGLEVFLIENAVDSKVFRVIKNVQEDIDERKYILHVTSFFSDKKNQSKGGYYVLELAKRLPQYTFIIAGEYKFTEEYDFSNNIIFLGHIKSQEELVRYYNKASLTLLTSKGETFGMACAESLCCGTPVVGFCAGGTESITLKEYSKFVSYGNLEELQKAILGYIDIKEFKREEISKLAQSKFSIEKMTCKYMEIYKLMENKRYEKFRK